MLEYFNGRPQISGKITYIFLMDVIDEFEKAERSAQLVTEFLRQIEKFGDWKNNVDEAIKAFINKTKYPNAILHSIQIY